MDKIFNTKTLINCRGKLLDLAQPIVMGILNITPDSFYDGDKLSDIEQIKKKTQKMLDEGATIIDIGAYSSRPGAQHVSEKEEMQRLQPVLELFFKEFPDTITSVDTFRANIAKEVVNNYGVSIINDISGGEMDKEMFATIAELNVPYILMHMQGTPQNMQQNPVYKDVVNDIITYFSEKVALLKKLGLHDIILDPGFGFGKTLEHNYTILNHLGNFKLFELPVLAGLSRKSMIYKSLNCTPAEALNGTTVLNTMALTKGASILRVHDVKEAKHCIDLYKKTINRSNH